MEHYRWIERVVPKCRGVGCGTRLARNNPLNQGYRCNRQKETAKNYRLPSMEAFRSVRPATEDRNSSQEGEASIRFQIRGDQAVAPRQEHRACGTEHQHREEIRHHLDHRSAGRILDPHPPSSYKTVYADGAGRRIERVAERESGSPFPDGPLYAWLDVAGLVT